MFRLRKTMAKPRNIATCDSHLKRKLKTSSLLKGGSTFSQGLCTAMPMPLPSSSLSTVPRLPEPFADSGGPCRGEEVSWRIALLSEKGREKETLQNERGTGLEAAKGAWKRQRHWDGFRARRSQWEYFNGPWIRPLQGNEMEK